MWCDLTPLFDDDLDQTAINRSKIAVLIILNAIKKRLVFLD
jgi:hypothetical protein